MTEMETGEPIVESVGEQVAEAAPEAPVVWPNSNEIYWYVIWALVAGVAAALLCPQQGLFTDPVLGRIALFLLTTMFVVSSTLAVAAVADHRVKTAQAQAETIVRAINRR